LEILTFLQEGLEKEEKSEIGRIGSVEGVTSFRRQLLGIKYHGGMTS
jgi:hypothetical protein